jgi:hypothetical protein
MLCGFMLCGVRFGSSDRLRIVFDLEAVDVLFLAALVRGEWVRVHLAQTRMVPVFLQPAPTHVELARQHATTVPQKTAKHQIKAISTLKSSAVKVLSSPLGICPAVSMRWKMPSDFRPIKSRVGLLSGNSMGSQNMP